MIKLFKTARKSAQKLGYVVGYESFDKMYLTTIKIPPHWFLLKPLFRGDYKRGYTKGLKEAKRNFKEAISIGEWEMDIINKAKELKVSNTVYDTSITHLTTSEIPSNIHELKNLVYLKIISPDA